MRSERVFQRRVKPNPGGPEDHDERRSGGREGGREKRALRLSEDRRGTTI